MNLSRFGWITGQLLITVPAMIGVRLAGLRFLWRWKLCSAAGRFELDCSPVIGEAVNHGWPLAV